MAAIPETLTREQYVYMAKLAEQAERYEEMVKYMEKLVIGNSTPGVTELTVEERNLLSIAYKNVIGSLRAAWRIVSSIEQKEESRKNDEHVSLVKDYRSKIESELTVVSAGILQILESHLVPSASTSESKVFYLKMKGDYHRYLAEFKVGDERKAAAEDTMSCYKAAQDIALVDLAPTHPIRLGLALNFSVFYFEILNSSEKACEMAKQQRGLQFDPIAILKKIWLDIPSNIEVSEDMSINWTVVWISGVSLFLAVSYHVKLVNCTFYKRNLVHHACMFQLLRPIAWC